MDSAADEVPLGAASASAANAPLHALGAVADIDALEPHGWTAAMWASRDGNEGCLRIYIQAGASLDSKNDGWTATMLAARNGHQNCLRMLIEAGVDNQAKTNDGRVADMVAADNNHPELSVVLEIISLS